MLAWRGGRTLLNVSDIKAKYGPWLQLYDLREHYDLFISYRWGTHDSDFTQALFDIFTNFSVGDHHRAMRLQEGRRFKSDFASALPIVSTDALVRVKDHSPDIVDNVLREWIMILEAASAKRVMKVFPILFGGRQAVEQTVEIKVLDFFSSGAMDRLPKIIPTATVAQASELLAANGIEPSHHLSSHTVHSVVAELLQFLLCKASDIEHNALVETFAEKVVALLTDCGANALERVSPSAVAPVTPVTPAAAVAAAPSPVPSGATVTAAPASPVSAGGVRDLKDLSVAEVSQLLQACKFENLVDVFSAHKVNGTTLFYCEEVGDLLAPEIGLTVN